MAETTMNQTALPAGIETPESKAYKRAYEMIDSWVVTQVELDYNSRLNR